MKYNTGCFTLNRIRASLGRKPSKYLRKLAAENNASLSSVQRTVQKNCKACTKFQNFQKLEEPDFKCRLNFSDWCIDKFNDNRIDFMNNLIISDEALFDLLGILIFFSILFKV